MLPQIQALYDDTILAWFLERYDVDCESVRFLGDSDSFVYEFSREAKQYILKITHSIRRTSEYLLGEINWLNYLVDQGASAAKAVASIHGNWVEVLQGDNGYFLSSIYEKAAGSAPTEDDWDEPLFEEWGRALGKLHAASKTYIPNNESRRLNEWHEEEYLNVNKYIPANEKIVIQQSNELISKLQNIPKTQDNYGLNHGDLQSHNFYLADKRIVMFDFDEVSYNYFVHDVAVVLFQAYWRPLKEPADKHAFVELFLNRFINGYNQEHHFQTEWFAYLADFLKIRHLTFYICFLQGCDLNSLSEAERAENDHAKRVITEEWPIVDYDFVEFSKGRLA